MSDVIKLSVATLLLQLFEQIVLKVALGTHAQDLQVGRSLLPAAEREAPADEAAHADQNCIDCRQSDTEGS